LNPKDTILVASWDATLADVRKRALESAGYVVLQSKGSAEVRDICRKRKVNLVLIGYSLPPAEKRRVWDAARKVCKTPILELYPSGGKPELMDSTALFSHEAFAPDDFVTRVQSILKSSTN
jgi:DNA-binding response OmpR family regulator